MWQRVILLFAVTFDWISLNRHSAPSCGGGGGGGGRNASDAGALLPASPLLTGCGAPDSRLRSAGLVWAEAGPKSFTEDPLMTEEKFREKGRHHVTLPS